METRTRIEEIIWCEGQAAELARDSEELLWTAARLIAQELDAGRTQRDVAADIGKGQAHVSFMFQVHKIAGDNHGYQSKIAGDYLGNQERSFNDIYQEVKGRPPAARREAVKELAEQGESGRAIAKRLGMDEKTVRKAIRESEAPREPIPADPAATCSGFNVASIQVSAVQAELKLMAEVQTWTQKDVDRARKYLNAALRKLNTVEKGL